MRNNRGGTVGRSGVPQYVEHVAIGEAFIDAVLPSKQNVYLSHVSPKKEKGDPEAAQKVNSL
jgi:hypothetical protein